MLGKVCAHPPKHQTVGGRQHLAGHLAYMQAASDQIGGGADPLVLHHQQLRDGAAANGLSGHHPHASPEERLHQVHPR